MCPFKEQELFSNSGESDSNEEDMEDSDSDSSDLSTDDDILDSPGESDEPQEEPQVVAVELPEEVAELAEGREDYIDDDEVVQAILRARERHRNHPPEIECEDGVTKVSFHPEQNMIAVATFTGDTLLYKYSDASTELVSTLELHMKAVRGIEFSEDGSSLISCSKDKSITVSNVETGKLVRSYDKAHEDALYALYVIDENVFTSGCESGFVKLWDLRQEKPIFSIRVMEDMVTAMITTEQKKYLAVTSGGTLTTINLHSRKMHIQSEEYEHDLTCLGLFRQESKLVAGSSKGTMYTFNWGDFGYHCDEFHGAKQDIGCLIAVAENVVLTGCEDGNIRATHLYPRKHLGVVGQHNVSVDTMDKSHDGTIIASAAAAGNIVKFWNIKYFEELDVAFKRGNKRKELKHNLPSSSIKNAGDFFSDLAGPS